MALPLKHFCIAVFASGGFAAASQADEDWFIVIWEFDRAATYSQFESIESRPEEIIACYEEGGCGVGGSCHRFLALSKRS